MDQNQKMIQIQFFSSFWDGTRFEAQIQPREHCSMKLTKETSAGVKGCPVFFAGGTLFSFKDLQGMVDILMVFTISSSEICSFCLKGVVYKYFSHDKKFPVHFSFWEHQEFAGTIKQHALQFVVCVF